MTYIRGLRVDYITTCSVQGLAWTVAGPYQKHRLNNNERMKKISEGTLCVKKKNSSCQSQPSCRSRHLREQGPVLFWHLTHINTETQTHYTNMAIDGQGHHIPVCFSWNEILSHNLTFQSYFSISHSYILTVQFPMMITHHFVLRRQQATGFILCMRPANERWRYIVTSSLIGWAHTQNGEPTTGMAYGVTRLQWHTQNIYYFSSNL